MNGLNDNFMNNRMVVKYTIFAILFCYSSHALSTCRAMILFGFNNAKKFQIKQNENNPKSYYIQAGSFKKQSNALRYQKSLMARTEYPVLIKSHDEFNAVIIGPIPDAKTVLSEAERLSAATKPAQISVEKNKTSSVNNNDHKQDQKRIAKNPQYYIGINGLYGRQSVSTISSKEHIDGAVQIDKMNPLKLNKNEIGYSLMAGYAQQLEAFVLRTEVQFNDHGKMTDNISPAFPPPPEGIPDFYTGFKTDLKSRSLFANAFLQKKAFNSMALYAGGGLGVSFIHADSVMSMDMPPWPARDSSHQHSRKFAWQLGAGGLYFLRPNISLNLAYMYADLGKPSYGTFYVHLPSIPGRAIYSKPWKANNLLFGVYFYLDGTISHK